MLSTTEPLLVGDTGLGQSEERSARCDQSEARDPRLPLRPDVASRTFLCKLPAIARLMPGNLGLTLLTRDREAEETRHFERSGL